VKAESQLQPEPRERSEGNHPEPGPIRLRRESQLKAETTDDQNTPWQQRPRKQRIVEFLKANRITEQNDEHTTVREPLVELTALTCVSCTDDRCTHHEAQPVTIIVTDTRRHLDAPDIAPAARSLRTSTGNKNQPPSETRDAWAIWEFGLGCIACTDPTCGNHKDPTTGTRSTNGNPVPQASTSTTIPSACNSCPDPKSDPDCMNCTTQRTLAEDGPAPHAAPSPLPTDSRHPNTGITTNGTNTGLQPLNAPTCLKDPICQHCEQGLKRSLRRAANRLRRNQSARSEERRVGKECRSRWSPYH
jgi:hypothetical protein